MHRARPGMVGSSRFGGGVGRVFSFGSVQVVCVGVLCSIGVCSDSLLRDLGSTRCQHPPTNFRSRQILFARSGGVGGTRVGVRLAPVSDPGELVLVWCVSRALRVAYTIVPTSVSLSSSRFVRTALVGLVPVLLSSSRSSARPLVSAKCPGVARVGSGTPGAFVSPSDAETNPVFLDFLGLWSLSDLSMVLAGLDRFSASSRVVLAGTPVRGQVSAIMAAHGQFKYLSFG